MRRVATVDRRPGAVGAEGMSAAGAPLARIAAMVAVGEAGGLVGPSDCVVLEMVCELAAGALGSTGVAIGAAGAEGAEATGDADESIAATPTVSGWAAGASGFTAAGAVTAGPSAGAGVGAGAGSTGVGA
jgi:hypothetical protein